VGLIRWIDRNLWSVPFLVFLLSELGLGLWSVASGKPVLLATAPVTTRQAVYSSLTGSASALLGLALAAVAILVAFAPRSDPSGQTSKSERRLARARTIIAGSLLAASFFMFMVVITATIALAMDGKQNGNSAITTLIEASGFASVIGLLNGGVGLALVVVDRSRQ
jgi:hypothetical protein